MNRALSQVAALTGGLLLWGAAFAQSAIFPDFIELINKHSGAVVSINASGEKRSQRLPESLPIPEDSPFYDYFKRFFEQEPNGPRPRQRPLSSVGSGFIISPDGYILTNAHVVEGTDTIIVALNDRTELEATVVGADPRTDVALLKVETDLELPAVTIGDPTNLQVGQWVLAIGSPFGFNYTATQGIISGLGRSLPSGNYVPFIQTDAAVNPGNSGGPLFNLDGEVIGINSQIYSRTGGYQGVSFAIPINVAMDVALQLKESGKVSRGWLGVLIQEVTAELAEGFGLDRPRGALVGQVMANSPAQKAGLQPGDIIIAFNDHEVNSSSELPPMVGLVRPGSNAALTIIRDHQEETVNVTIEELPDDPRQQALAEPKTNRLHITIGELSEEQRADTSGVEVKEVKDGPAAAAGIRPGDIIVELNKQKVTSVDEFERLVKELPTGKSLPVLIRRGDGSQFLAMTLAEGD